MRSWRRASARMRHLQSLRPRTVEQLQKFVHKMLGLHVPRSVLCAASTPPFDYLAHAYFEHEPGDCVVWANRGGGKTMLGAVATLLDLLFKPGIQVRILGGSLEQSTKMYEHLRSMLDRPALRGVLATGPTLRRVLLANGSRAELLAGSQRSVRGTRVHKLRCDEVEQFAPDVWEAAQLVTRSGTCGGAPVRGGIEALSTMHRPFGLMARLTRDSDGKAMRLFRWNALDVIERCPPQRPCEGCELWQDCRGRAKDAEGFIAIDDLIAQRRRTSDQTWAAEMMCRQPRRSDSVYPNFEVRRHVSDAVRDGACVAGMDFGLRSPTVFLWAIAVGGGIDARLHVVDEYAERGLTVEQHLIAIERQAARRGRGKPQWIGVDPAGQQRNDQTGLSAVDLLRRRGYEVRAQASRIPDGVERIRRRLDRGTLLIHPRCARLIEALTTYHFDPRHPHRDEPVKDGPDHACDALRYLVHNLEKAPAPVEMMSYL